MAAFISLCVFFPFVASVSISCNEIPSLYDDAVNRACNLERDGLVISMAENHVCIEMFQDMKRAFNKLLHLHLQLNLNFIYSLIPSTTLRQNFF